MPIHRSGVTLTLLFIITLISLSAQGQKRASHWPFADYELNFVKDTVNVTNTYATHLNRGMGVISDETGSLLMYTDGYSVFNKNHQVMPNGADLIPSTQVTSAQQSMIVPKPGSNNIYYIFTVDPWNGQTTSGLYYSEVDLSLNGGLGDVTSKGTRLVENTTSNLSATFHSNGRDVWVITHQNATNKYFVLLITDQGISSTIQESDLGPTHTQSEGQLKFSPDGRKAAVSYVDPPSGMSLFDFDNSTGILSNPMNFSFTDLDNSPATQGLEFSSDGKKLYVYELRNNIILQYDISLGTYDQINKSRYRVPGSINYNSLRQFQLAPDGKIYATKGGGGGGTDYLGVITNPNAPGPEVVVKENGLYLEGGDSFVNLTPIFIQNYFFKTGIHSEGKCQDSPVSFTITNETNLDSVRWYFGEGSTSKSRNPKLKYEVPGKYKVTLLAYYSGVADTVRQELTINPYIQFNLGNDTTMCYGSKFSVGNNFASYRWSTGDTTRTIRIQQQGILKLTAFNSLGCAFSDSLQLTVSALPIFNMPDSVLMGDQTSVVLSPGNFISYLWNTGETSPTLSVNKEGWYSVEVENSLGCSAAKSVFVKDNVPPVFTPAPKWERLHPKPSGSAGTDIYFLDDRNGFIVNGQELLQTNDGGDSWKIQMKMPFGRRISFKNSIGYVVGDNGTFYKSTQYGGGWNKMNSPSSGNLNAITIIHPDTLLVTNDKNLYVSYNGGQTWMAYIVGNVDIEDSYFTSTKVGHVACKNGIILKTADGGVTWRTTLSSNVIPSNFFRIKFANPLVGYATSEFTNVYKTIDGGETWHLVSSPDPGYAMQFLDENTGFIAGEDGAMEKTTDGGATWHWIGFDGRKYGNDIYALFFLNENQGYATGLGGRIMRTFNGGKTWNGYAITYYSITQMEFTSKQIAYALIGDEIFKTGNQGNSWTNLGAPLRGQKTARFDFVNDSVGFALVGGDQGTSAGVNLVYKTTDGGASWSETIMDNTLSYGDYSFIGFVNKQVGFVSGGYGYGGVFRTANGGANWTLLPISTRFGHIQFLNDSVGYAHNVQSSYNRMYKTVDGGNTWNVSIEVTQGIRALYFLDESTGFFVGDNGMMYKTTNGGQAWQQQTNAPYGYFVDIKFYTERIGYIIDDYHNIYVTTNAGATWTNDLVGQTVSLLAIFGADVYAAGGYASVLRHSIAFTDVVVLQPLSMVNLKASTASVVSHVLSTLNLSSVPLLAEIRKQNENYSSPFQIKILNGYTDEDVVYEFQNLEPSTTYFCRFRISIDNNVSVTPEFSFTTATITAIEPEHEKSFSIYPNPAHDRVVVEAKDTGSSFTYVITDLVGQTVMAGASTGQSSIILTDLKPGIYLLSIDDRQHKVTVRVVKE